MADATPALGLEEFVAGGSATYARDHFEWSSLWDAVDGDRERLNIAHECLDRHRDRGTAVRLAGADGSFEELGFDQLSTATSQFAHLLEARGIEAGQRVGVMAEPSLGFYAAMFGAIKRGAVAVPLFTLFGPEALAARIHDCEARLLVVGPDQQEVARGVDDVEILVLDEALTAELARQPSEYTPVTASGDLAVLQYTSGTSRLLPEAVPHSHRSIVTLLIAARFGLGLAAGDRYFCPSSPAWGHGLWHGTISPWAVGVAAGAYVGRFSPSRLVEALRHFEITNLAAAGTVYRMLLQQDEALPRLAKASYTGEALDETSLRELETRLGTPVCGMYGTTETGVLIANYPGFSDFRVVPGALGKPVPGWEVTVLDADRNPVAPGVTGEICVRRRGEWSPSRDLGQIDQDGYFWYYGRADDVIISAGWTISPLEVEQVLCAHPNVANAAVIGIPDATRGQILKAFAVSDRRDEELIDELQELVRSRLSPHEYPRAVEIVGSLPLTMNGKVNRRALREQAHA